MKKSVNKDRMISIYWGISFSLLFDVLFLPCFGQDGTKKKATPEDYSKWGSLNTVAAAVGSDWISFRMVYDNTDTLFVKNSSTGKEFLIPKWTDGRFLGDGHYLYRRSPDIYEVISLSSSEKSSFSNTQWLEVSENQKYLLTAQALTGTPTTLAVRNLKGIILRTMKNVIEYSLNPTHNALLYTSKTEQGYTVAILDLDTLAEKQITSGPYPYTSLAWQTNGRSLAFSNNKIGDTASTLALYLYNRKSGHLKGMGLADKTETANSRISKQSGLRISGDGTTVFFSIENHTKKASKLQDDTPEIWYSNEPLLYPASKWMQDARNNADRYAWYVESDLVHQINTEAMDDIKFTGRDKYVISKRTGKYPDNYRFHPDVDYYISPVKERHQMIFLKKQSSDPSMFSTSPVSDLIAYYRNKQWYLYDPETHGHRNLTSGTGIKWDNEGDNRIPPTIPYGVAGWSADGGSILLYDRFDIWLFDLRTTKGKRITNGREKNISYRLQPNAMDRRINIDDGLLLVGHNSTEASRSYYLWRKGKKSLNICTANTWNDQITGSPDGNLIFREQSSGNPPHLIFFSAKSHKRRITYLSNPHQKQYEWGKSEMIRYNDKNGNELNGALFYPAGYKKERKYPMIVYIYESTSQRLHQYERPSMFSEEGFNVTNYALDGYFVLLPDIYYQIGSPGNSAVDCITAAVRAVMEKAVIDKSKIGLIGHSFGAYESNIVIAKTDTFAAAVSGDGHSDTIGFYFGIGEETGTPEAWRFENQQMRMGKPFFEDRQGYIDNSPLMNAATIHTPLLLWSGKNDSTVPVGQSIAMHIALRRLGKKNIFLCYPDENHVISNRSMQEDLTIRIRDWFDYFLKDHPAPEWIHKGLQ